jgi:integrase
MASDSSSDLKDEQMTMPTGVTRRGGVYWLRVGIPDDLRHLYPRTSKGALAADRHRASLRTSDKGEARAKALALRAEFEHEFNAKRKALVPPAVRPTAALRSLLAESVYAERLAIDDRQRKDKNKSIGVLSGAWVGSARPELPTVNRFEPLPDRFVAARVARNAQGLAMVRHALATGDLAVMLPIANKAAKALGIEIEWDSEEGADALEACLRSYTRALEAITQRDEGRVIDTPEAPNAPQAAQEAPGAPQSTQADSAPKYRTIRDLVPLWLSKSKQTAASQADMNRALRMLDESGIPTELATLKGIHGATFRDWLRDTEARVIVQKTASDRFGAIKTLLYRGVEYGALTTNPWAGIRFPVEGSKRREPFRHDELRAIHQSPQFSTYSGPSGRKGAEAVPYFMPLLGLFSGARVGELVQLEVADVRQHNDVWVLDIHKEAEGSTVKTDNGIRRIPIHPELVRLGLMDYLADLRAAGETKLFPSLHQPGTKKPGYLFGQAFRAYLNKVGVTRPLATFHAYRHGFRSALENAGVSAVRIHRLVGHADDSVDARYTHLDMSVMAEDVAKIRFPFLDLLRVYPLPAASKPSQGS